MFKKLQKYFYLLVILLNGILSFANSGNTYFTYNKTVNSITEQVSNAEVKVSKTIFANFKKSIEVSESEIEEEEACTITFCNNFNFFNAYFNIEICANFKHLVQNRLAPCKHIEFLSSKPSLYISFCDFRI